MKTELRLNNVTNNNYELCNVIETSECKCSGSTLEYVCFSFRHLKANVSLVRINIRTNHITDGWIIEHHRWLDQKYIDDIPSSCCSR